ncbi:hypothetical protein PR048_009461, partial [Dryococelus australis]
MRTYLEHEELWQCVAGEEKDDKKVAHTRAKIICMLKAPIQQRRHGTNEYVNNIITTAHKLQGINFEVSEEWIGTLLLTGLPEEYRPIIMGLESSGTPITEDSVKTKQLQAIQVTIRKPVVPDQELAIYSSKGTRDYNKGLRCYDCNGYDTVKAEEVLYVPDLSTNLLSVSRIDKHSHTVLFNDNGCHIYINWELMATASLVNNMCRLDQPEERTNCTRISSKDFHSSIRGSRAHESLQLVHSDICGLMEEQSIGGSLYFFTLIDKYTRELGIQHQTTCPYTPEQNGLVERLNCTLVEKARCLLIEARLDCTFWAEAVNTAAYLHNRSPSSVLDGQTPEEVLSGRKTRLATPASYCENSKGYQLLKQGTTGVIKSHDIVFVESEGTHSETKKGVRKSPNPITSLQIMEDTSTPIINDVEDDTHHQPDSLSEFSGFEAQEDLNQVGNDSIEDFVHSEEMTTALTLSEARNQGRYRIRRIDYEATFAPVVRHASTRMILALAVKYDLDIDHMDE